MPAVTQPGRSGTGIRNIQLTCPIKGSPGNWCQNRWDINSPVCVGMSSRRVLCTSVPYWGHKNEQKVRELLWLKLGWRAAQIWPVPLWPPHPRDLKGSKPLLIQSSSLTFLIDEVERLSLKDAGPCPGLLSPLVSGHGHFDSQATASEKPPNSITKTLDYPWNPVIRISQS